jgi:hypothetical protein
VKKRLLELFGFGRTPPADPAPSGETFEGRAFVCPPDGPTEANIALSLFPIPGSGRPPGDYFARYRIRDWGTGLEALLRGIGETAGPKFGIELPADFAAAWDAALVARCRCRLRDRRTGKSYRELRPRSVFEVLREDPPSRGRAREIEDLARPEIDSWSKPVFLSAGVLGRMGVPGEPETCRLLDGARRIAAFALLGREEFEAGLVMTKEEYNELADPRAN